jgi:hypothetical protein
MSAFSVSRIGLAVVHRLGVGQQFQVLLDAVGDRSRMLARSAGGSPPSAALAAWAASSASSMSAAVERAAWV